ncbi:unnamed protein product [Leptidea sinapis]|uniref:PiggyBac transposable element-derived protein domain-containing protein n=1 Tax=Leptidea sinapis TaxID=189913 RepID=A0A5E4QF06_9NEOP|nr:unnamed protein product [Leptidea sinapis]
MKRANYKCHLLRLWLAHLHYQFRRLFRSELSSSDDDDDSDSVVPFLLPREYQQSLDIPMDPKLDLPVPPIEPPTAIPEKKPGDQSIKPELDGLSDGAMQPVDLFHFMWSDYPNPPIPSREKGSLPFTQQNVGPTVRCRDPYEIFTTIWDQKIMNHIVKETNRYAEDQVSRGLERGSLGPWSRINFWQEYWSTDEDIFATPGFRAVMYLKRFQFLSSCLHFNDNRNMRAQELSPSQAKLFKLEPIITHLNHKFQAMYTLDQNISVNESLLQWKGWLSINQFIGNKSAKVGIKTYEICESQSGYLWRFDVHAHKRAIPQTQH